MSDDETIEHIARHVQSYLAARPNAADTLRGIGEWWFIGSTLRPQPAELRAALRLLEARGEICCQRLPDGTEIWRNATRR